MGYAGTGEIAKESVKTGKSIRDLVIERGLMDAARLDQILSVDAMTRGGIVGEGGAGRGGGGGGRKKESAPRGWRSPSCCPLRFFPRGPPQPSLPPPPRPPKNRRAASFK